MNTISPPFVNFRVDINDWGFREAARQSGGDDQTNKDLLRKFLNFLNLNLKLLTENI